MMMQGLPKGTKRLHYVSSFGDPIYLQGVPRQSENGDVSISWFPFLKRYNELGETQSPAQIGQEISISRYLDMMHRHSNLLHQFPRNMVRLSRDDAPRLLEMMEWCSLNVTGGFARWSCRLVDDIMYTDDHIFYFDFCFMFKKHAALFKLTFT